ncbi:MAG: hypothetical protein P8Z42_02320 [Anaerolineales bacterium]
MLSRLKRSWPLWVTFIVAGAYIVARLAVYDWNVVALAEIGTQFSEGDPAGTEGYDGQFTYYIAVDLNPATVSDKLDVPAYRYQRILLPALAHFFTGGHATAIPRWNVCGHALPARLWSSHTICIELWVVGRSGFRRRPATA